MRYTRNLSSSTHTHKPHMVCVKNTLTAAEMGLQSDDKYTTHKIGM